MTAHENIDVTTYIGVVIGILCVLVLVLIYYFKRRSVRLSGDNEETNDGNVLPQLLQSNARRLGLLIYIVEGNDMYAALADQLLHQNPRGTYTSDIVRNRAVEDIRNSTLYTILTSGNWDGNVESLNEIKGWQKDILMFHAVSNAFRRTIEVIHGDRMESTTIRPFHFAVSQSTQVLYVGYCGRERYVSLRLHNRSTAEYQRTDSSEGRTETDVSSEGRHNETDPRHNILIGDGSYQYIVHQSSNEYDSDEYVITRNIVVGEGNTQNVLATFRTAQELIEFLRRMQLVGVYGSQPVFRLKIRQMSSEISDTEIEENERRLIDLLEDESSEARLEMNEILENFGVSFETAMQGCILLHLTPDSNQALLDFVRKFQNGELVRLLSFLITKQYKHNRSVLDINVQLQMQINLSDIELRQIVNHTENRQWKQQHAANRRARTESKKMSPGLSLILKKTKIAKPGIVENGIPEKVTQTMLKYFRKTEVQGRNPEMVDVQFEQFCSTNMVERPSGRHEVLQNASNAMSEAMKGSVGVVLSDSGIRGTCFRVGNKFVMTAYHVVDKIQVRHELPCAQPRLRTNIYVKFPDTGEECCTKITYTSKDLDIAVLEIILPQTSTYFSALTQVTACRPGLPFYLVGFPIDMMEREVERAVFVRTDVQIKELPFNKVLFLSDKFDYGCSGTPGVVFINGQASIATMLLGLVSTDTDVNYYGVRMTDVYKRLEIDRPDLARQILCQKCDKRTVKLYGLFVYVSVAYMYMSRKYLYLEREIRSEEYVEIITGLLKVQNELRRLRVMFD